IAFSVIESIRGRIMLDNEIIPVKYPECAVGPHLGFYRAEPIIRAGDYVPAITLFHEAGALLLQDVPVHQPPRRFRYECHPVPVFLRECTGGVQAVPRRSGEAPMHINLAELLGEHMHVIMGVDLLNTALTQVRLLIVTQRDGEKVTVLVIRCGNEHVKLFRKTKPPRVVGRIAQKLKIFRAGIESVIDGPELNRPAAYRSFKPGVTHRSPDLVVHAVAEIGWPSVRIIGSPSLHEYF